ncbi:MAG TPA: DUF3016 domain-containing protein [Burkholderiaceae bacterium]|nr:DUF3016 domain-containing protein [Burkholderiaceae bacterium]
MRSKLFVAAALIAASNANADLKSTQPTLTVRFADPRQFTDASFSYDRERERSAVLRGIEQHLQRLAADRLAAGRSLEIEVLDIDLAGQVEPWHARTADVRIVREIDWPRIALRYTLRDGNEVLASGEEQLTDMSFLRSANLYDRNDRLRYEKAMLDDWFERRVAVR